LTQETLLDKRNGLMIDSDLVLTSKEGRIVMKKIDRSPEKRGLSVLNADDNFRFACHNSLACFTKCCRDITIFLTPYDILRMKNGLKMSSEDFLPAYTATLIGDSGLPVVALKMLDDEEKSCMDVPFCVGLDEDKVLTVKEWKKEQGISIYREMENLFKKITMNEFLSNKTINNKKIQEMYYMACYDLDRFRRFIFKSKFLETFDVDTETVGKIKHDDVELYKFAMRWLEYGLLGQHVLKVKPEVIKAKKQEVGIE
jgi:hypothetical protein